MKKARRTKRTPHQGAGVDERFCIIQRCRYVPDGPVCLRHGEMLGRDLLNRVKSYYEAVRGNPVESNRTAWASVKNAANNRIKVRFPEEVKRLGIQPGARELIAGLKSGG